MEQTNALGRRKTAVARVYLQSGTGNIVINGVEVDKYFPTLTQQYKVRQAFNVTNTLGSYDVKVNVKGGGLTGQVEAVRLGVARALVDENEELRGTLRQHGLLTRDPRMVERKKFGQKKARKKFQFSKR
ncbi:MAG: 30S ribosomal protein S9 [Luteibaculaceae bacterium]